MNIKIRTIILLFIYSIVFVIIYIFCSQIIWSQDELYYQFNFNDGERIHSIGDIILSQVGHYFGQNGRFCIHFLVQFFVSLADQRLFALFNSIFTIVFILLIIHLAKKDWKNITASLTAVLICLFFCDTHYTPPCQINYIWGGTFTLAFLCLLFSKFRNCRNILLIVLAALYSIFAGNGNEAINIGVAGALFIYALINYRKITIVQWIILSAFWLGTAILCLAPSNFGRAEEINLSVIYSLYILATTSRALYLLLLLVLYDVICKKKSIKSLYFDNMLYFNAIAISLLFNLIIGIYSNRQLFGIEMFSAIIVLNEVNTRVLGRVQLAIASIAVLLIYYIKYEAIKEYNYIYSQLYQGILDSAKPIYIDYLKESAFIAPAPPVTPITEYEIMCAHALKANKLSLSYPETVVYPIEMDSLLREPIKNRYAELDCGLYILLQDKKRPANFVLKRDLNLLGVTLPYPDFTISFNRDSKYNTDEYNVIISTLRTPFIDINGIDIQEYE